MQHISVVFIYTSQSSLGINAIKIHTCKLELPSILIFRNKIISNTRKQNIRDEWPEKKETSIGFNKIRLLSLYCNGVFKRLFIRHNSTVNI